MNESKTLVLVGMLAVAVLLSGCIEENQELTTTLQLTTSTTTIHILAPENYPQVVEVGAVPSEEALAEWEQFKEKYGDFHDMRWNSYADSPERISGRRIKITNLSVSTPEIAEQVVMGFIKENKELLNVKIEELELKQVRESTNSKEWGVEYVQVYNQIPVYQGVVRMSIMKDGKMDTLTNQFYPNVSIPTTPRLTKEEAEGIALDFVNISREQAYGIDMELYIYPKQEKGALSYHLIWIVDILTCKDVFVDAYTGTIVAEYFNTLDVEICRYRQK